MAKAVAFIGRPKYLELRLAENADFSCILEEITFKLQEGGRFFEGSQCVRVLGVLSENERERLTKLLVEDYCVAEVEFIGDIRAERRPEQCQRRTIPGTGSSLNFDLLHEDEQQPAPFDISLDDAAKIRNRLKKSRIEPDRKTRIKHAMQNDRQIIKLMETTEEDEEPVELHSGVSKVRESNALVVSETVRNGQRVAYDGDIVVLGDANVGAELVATGCIIIMGTLRGMAHAGSAGDETATVSAYRLSPRQLRIGAFMAIAPEDAAEVGYPEIASVQKGGIVIMPLVNNKKSR